MNRMLAFGMAAALSIPLLPQCSPGAEAEEKKTKTQNAAREQGLSDLGQKQKIQVLEANNPSRKKAKGVNQTKAKGGRIK